MNREHATEVSAGSSLVPAVRTASANGVAVDLRGYDSATAYIYSGAIVASGNQTPKLQAGELSDGSDAVDVAAADLVGSFSVIAADSIQKVGYKGSKRYLRVVITHNSGTSVATAALIVRGHSSIKPVE